MTMTRKLTGEKPAHSFPRGAVDTQMHMYLPGFPACEGGPGLPVGELPDASAYRKVMKWLGIDRMIITQGNAHQCDNSNLLACVQEMGECARAVAVVTAETSQKELQNLADGGVVGVRIMDLPGGAVGLADLEAIDAIAADMGWMMAIQFNGSDLPLHAFRLLKLKSRWVFDHHGKFFQGYAQEHIDLVKQLLDGGNTWFKFAGCYETSKTGSPDYRDIAEMARLIGAYSPERIVWGTNWPHNGATTTQTYPDEAQLADLAMSWLPNEAARHRALVENPEELFGLPPAAF